MAVGLTPEMLPMIVTVCLSKGAMAMSRKKVIVKRLNSIQNFGAMDVLCTDKTGTLTMDQVILEQHCDVVRERRRRRPGAGLPEQPLPDRAEERPGPGHPRTPRKSRGSPDCRLHARSTKSPSIFAASDVGGRQDARGSTGLICKGAPEDVFERCARFELDGEFYPMDHILIDDMREEYDDLSADGFRVLAMAYKDMEPKPAYSKETNATCPQGYMAFLDPPKETAAAGDRRAAQARRRGQGPHRRQRTGQPKICNEVGIATEHVLLGGQVETMTDAELAEAAEKTTLFARLSPAHKQRVIKALQSARDTSSGSWATASTTPRPCAPPTWASPSTTAVDIAKESADVILLEKSLLVLEEGVLEGRKVFANILKYIRMGASSNFGNMFSVLGASAFLPFLPMAPIQILTNNLLYDFSQVPIPTDDVDPEQIAKPRPWSMSEITRFILFIGPISSIFDYTTYFMMLYLFDCWNQRTAAVPDRLVRRVAAHPDPDHPRHPHQQIPLPPEPGQLAADPHLGGHHGGRHVAALLADRRVLGFTPLPALFWGRCCS